MSRRSFVRQVATMLVGRGVLRGTQFVTFVILARVLTPAEFGWFGLVTTAISLAAVLGSLGLRQSFTYEIGQGRMAAGQAVGTSLALWLPLTALSATVVCLLYASSIPGMSTTWAALMITVGVGVAILHSLLQGVFLGRGTIWAFSLSEAIPRAFLMAATICFAILSMLSLTSSLWLNAAGFAIAIPLMLVLAARGGGRVRANFTRIRPMLGYGLIFAVNLFLVTLCARVSMFVIELFRGPDAAGQFFAAIRVNEIFLEVTTAIGLVLFSRAARESDRSSALLRGVRLGAWLFWLFIVVGAIVALAAPFVLTLVVGPAYQDATPALQVLALALAPTAACKMIYPSLAGTGRPLFGTPVLVLSLTANTAAAFALVPFWGPTGGAAGFAVGQFALLFGYALTCKKRYGIRVSDFLWPDWRELGRVVSSIIDRKRG